MSKNYISETTPSVNILGEGTEIKGDLTTNGDIRIDGALKGTVRCNGKLVIGTSGKVEGDIFCQNADISGEAKAHVTVYELLTLKASAIVNGDINTQKLAIEPGAVFTGACNMGKITVNEKPGTAE